jgi:hypothetical protein
MTFARTLARVAALALGLASIPAAAQSGPRAFYLNQWGGVNGCHLAATDTQVEYCAGEIEAPALNPARFDCRKAEVLSEYQFCRKPLPRRASR